MDEQTRKPLLEGVALEAALARLQKIRDDLPNNEYAQMATYNAEMELLGQNPIYNLDVWRKIEREENRLLTSLASWFRFDLAYAIWFGLLLLFGLTSYDMFILFFAATFPIIVLVGGIIFVRAMHDGLL